VPFLGDIPGVGNLFKSTLRSSEKTELLIFLTPRIVSESLTSVR
jgi:type IV pilus assembly protein PilQ